MTALRSYRLPGRRALAACESAVLEAARAWATHWLAGPDAWHAAQAAAADLPSAAQAQVPWTHLLHADADLWMIAWLSPEDRLWLANHAAGGPVAAGDFGGAPGPLGEQLVAAMLADLGRRVFGSAMPAPAVAPAVSADELMRSMNQPGSGAAIIALTLERRRLLLGFSGGLLERLAGSPPATRKPASLLPRSATLGPQKLRVRLCAGSASVTVRDLHNLQVGDVIRLDSLISEPLKLQREDGSLACRAHLGSLEGAFACQVSR